MRTLGMTGTIGGRLVYEAYTNGDGIFDEFERDFHLGRAKRAILGWLNEH